MRSWNAGIGIYRQCRSERCRWANECQAANASKLENVQFCEPHDELHESPVVSGVWVDVMVVTGADLSGKTKSSVNAVWPFPLQSKPKEGALPVVIV